MSWWQNFLAEAKNMLIKDPRRIIFLVGASIAYLVLFSILYSPGIVKNIPLVIYDEDNSMASRVLIQCIADSERFKITSQVNDQEVMNDLVKTKEAAVGIQIPRDFAKNIKLGLSADVLIFADGSNLVTVNAATTNLQNIIGTIGKGAGMKILKASSGPSNALDKVNPVNVKFRVLNNPTESYLNFFVIGLALAALQQGIFLSIGGSFLSKLTNCDEEEYSWAKLSAKIMPYFLGAICAYIITLMIASIAFGVPFKANIVDLMIIGACFSFSVIGFAWLLAIITKNELIFSRCSIFYTVPAFVFSGYTWPQQAMEPISYGLSMLFPLTHLASCVRDLMLMGSSPVVYVNSIILLMLGTIFFIIARWGYKNKVKIQA